jgi:hypothetical protein
MRVNENGKGHALFWATKPIQDPHQMPTMRPPLLPHYEEEMRGMRFRCLSQDSTLLLAKQEREPSKNRVKNTHNAPESHPTVLEESLCFLIPFTALWAGRLVWLGYLPDSCTQETQVVAGSNPARPTTQLVFFRKRLCRSIIVSATTPSAAPAIAAKGNIPTSNLVPAEST